MQSSHSHIARISRRITPTHGHDHRFSGMLFFPSLFSSRSAIRSRDLPPISPRYARDTNLRLVAQHRVDAVRHPARAPHVLAFHPRGGLAGLFLPGLVDRPDHQAPRRRRAAPPPPGPLPRTGVPAHRRGGVPGRTVQQPLCRSGVRSPACWRSVHPFRSGSSLTSAATYFPACATARSARNTISAPPAARSVSGQRARPLC